MIKTFLFDDDDTRYRKKAKPKPTKKSNHKHNYIDVLLCYTLSTVDFKTGAARQQEHLATGERCTVCAKMNFKKMFWGTKEEQALPELYPDYPIIDTKCPWDKNEEIIID